jgi:hypothetical protein
MAPQQFKTHRGLLLLAASAVFLPLSSPASTTAAPNTQAVNVSPPFLGTDLLRPKGPGRPTVASVLRFRQQRGLDLDLGADAAAAHRRAESLVQQWLAGNRFSKKTARVWGCPLRHADLVELEYRKKYVGEAERTFPKWASSNAISSYAGLWIDERAGGIIHVGFTEDQEARVSDIVKDTSFSASARVAAFPETPSYTLVFLEQLLHETTAKRWRQVVRVTIDVAKNRVVVFTKHVEEVSALVVSEFGSSAPIVARYIGTRHLAPRN